MTDDQPRWVYRFDNYKRAFGLLREAIEIMETRELTALEKEGIVQRFEYTWELAWKVIKDYLEREGVVLDKVTPASVIRAAFAARVITNGEGWMKALDARNQMSHVYNMKSFEAVIEDIRTLYLGLFDELNMFLMETLVREQGSKP
ncbi:MAG: nucleotidyltransferase substrate binding protein [Alphaproteobacteria bacterium]|nr:nucleotidyltransferase substrate binding protein [Alphaproteobacteria bacterium]